MKETTASNAASIAVAYINGQSHTLAPAEAAAAIGEIYAAVERAETPAAVAAVNDTPVPAVSIRKSLTPEYLICINDGVKLKSLKRHLRTKFDLSPEEYRRMWGLPADYPMVAPAYAQRRSELAKAMGLGHMREAPPVKTKKRAGAR